ncbi:MAG TPA: cell wall hydrolase [Sphingomicrobium sp.]|nr:cell wall hydrolase [Sphingomicrobium sp.]
MVKLIGGRAASAVIGLFMLGLGSSATAQDMSALGNVAAVVKSVETDNSAKPLGTPVSQAASLVRPAIATVTTAVATPNGAIMQAKPAQSVTVKLSQSIAQEAAWLYKGGWPLYALVEKFATSAPLDEETNCLATAVYFEARGESLEGQLAVARVVMNRASSGKYPSDWCGVVKQPAQFSFVRHGEFPYVDTASAAWQKAEAVAELAASNVVPSVSSDVLWYHADYVAPAWRRSLQEVQQIGAHIFYRA